VDAKLIEAVDRSTHAAGELRAEPGDPAGRAGRVNKNGKP
jgi:hypothetical protein